MSDEPSTSSGRPKRSCTGNSQNKKQILTQKELQEIADNWDDWEDFSSSGSEYLNSESDDGSNSAGSSLPSIHSLDCDLDEVDTEESHNVNTLLQDNEDWHDVDGTSLRSDIFSGAEQYMYHHGIYPATSLLASKTHLLGTLRKNRKGLSKEVMSAQLKRGEIVGKENTTGRVIGKWKDKMDVPFLSTKHTLDIKATGKKNRKGEEVKKPSAISEYNAGKDGIDVSDQMASYFSPLRKTIRWYHKLMFEILLNTAVINSLNIYKHFKKQNIQVGAFREMLIESLTMSQVSQ
ncbi:unnamed protein product [Acanthoscelides obtectus]|uniref:PiggyBac transposable element-derived protein domain-containing protein n=1 Tax=Acanthoscelides obtectus TaxID=200917 RepID=A0A9P0P362_ACAOB|nr:unnamed protein product [Acanthoscelides obtectus]CAK1631051.1 PiggyBac transposable element-derived protein 4 [Acanthoscelides obtectus]